MSSKDMKKTVQGSSKSREKTFTLDLHEIKKNQKFMIESWIYMFDNICLVKMKQTKDFFRKKVIKFYKNYFPEYSYFKMEFQKEFKDFGNLPDKKNYLERVAYSQRFYKPSYQHQIDAIANERRYEDNEEFYNIVYFFKKLIKDLLKITYSSFYNESLILKYDLILEFCYQQLKYLEMEYFYCRMVFEIADQNYVLQRIICIVRRLYHFWVELLHESYCRYEKIKNPSKLIDEEKFLQNNKAIDERLQKYKNYHNLGKRNYFIDSKEPPKEESGKKASNENEMHEFSFEELIQQDEYDDPSLYVQVKSKEREIDLSKKIQDVLKYYPFIRLEQDIKQKEEDAKYKKQNDEEAKNFIMHIEMLVELNIKVLHEFLFSELYNWNYYEQQYIVIIQLYSFLKRALDTKSILVSIIETYRHFSNIDGCNLEYQEGKQKDDEEQKREKVYEEFRQLKKKKTSKQESQNINQESRKKPWWWRKLGGGIIDEEDLDEDLDFLGGDSDQIYDRESKAIERIVNHIIQQNNKRLLQLIDQYFKVQFEGENISNKDLFPIFLNDSLVLQKNEILLDDALAFDLSIVISLRKKDSQPFEKSETRSFTEISPSHSLKKQQTSLEDENQSAQNNRPVPHDKENDQNDNSIDIEDQFDEKEMKSEREFYKTSFKTKLQSRRYIMPLQYKDLTFPDNINIQVELTEFKDNQSMNDPFFDDKKAKQQKQTQIIDERPQYQRSNLLSQILEPRNQARTIFDKSKNEEEITDIEKFKTQALQVRLQFENVRGYTRQTNIFDGFKYIEEHESRIPDKKQQ